MGLTLDTALAVYKAADEHEMHAAYADLVARFHQARARAIRARRSGEIAVAHHFEARAIELSGAVARFAVEPTSGADVRGLREGHTGEAAMPDLGRGT